MKLKPGVIIEGLNQEMMFALGFLEAAYWDIAGVELVVTSGLDGHHSKQSKHYTGNAIDARTRNITPEQALKVHAFCLAKLDPRGFDTVLEGDHLHLERDPKAGEHLWRFADDSPHATMPSPPELMGEA